MWQLLQVVYDFKFTAIDFPYTIIKCKCIYGNLLNVCSSCGYREQLSQFTLSLERFGQIGEQINNKSYFYELGLMYFQYDLMKNNPNTFIHL